MNSFNWMVKQMNEWFFEHEGTLRAVRSKMARIKKSESKYFTCREWKILRAENGRSVFTALDNYSLFSRIAGGV